MTQYEIGDHIFVIHTDAEGRETHVTMDDKEMMISGVNFRESIREYMEQQLRVEIEQLSREIGMKIAHRNDLQHTRQMLELSRTDPLLAWKDV